jgi:hypothetical protein
MKTTSVKFATTKTREPPWTDTWKASCVIEATAAEFNKLERWCLLNNCGRRRGADLFVFEYNYQLQYFLNSWIKD